MQKGIVLINNTFNGNFQPLSEFLQDSSLELLVSDEEEVNSKYNRVYDCLVELRSSTWNLPDILESLLPTLPAPSPANAMIGDR